MNKRYVCGIAIFLVLIILCGIVSTNSAPDGRTLESREKLLAELPKGIDWHIVTEKEIDGYIVSAIVSSKYDGIAVFQPLEKGKYKCRTTTYKPKEDIIIATEYINEQTYNLIWCNVGNLSYAEIIYTINGVEEKPIRMDNSALELLILPSPADDFQLSVRYYDKNGGIIY